MKKLTQLIIICFAALFISSFKSVDNNSKDKLTISAQFINLENSSIEAVLWNNTADTIAMESMSCSWISFYRIDNKNLSFQQDLCFKNGPVIIKIPPYKSVKKILGLINTNNVHGVKFRIGFNYVKPIEYQKAISQREEFDKNENIIWSNNLFL